jgi:hypothetical protein
MILVFPSAAIAGSKLGYKKRKCSTTCLSRGFKVAAPPMDFPCRRLVTYPTAILHLTQKYMKI